MTAKISASADGTYGSLDVGTQEAFRFGADTSGQLAGFRNKIINGGMRINQRVYISGAATVAGQYTFDRWKVTGIGGITFSTVTNNTLVTIPAGQTIQQVIEGNNINTATYVLSWNGTAQGRINGGAYGTSGTVTASLTGGSEATIEFNTGTLENPQLERGSIATPFEHRPYGLELSLCQRYYQLGGLYYEGYTAGVSQPIGGANGKFFVPMRVSPTLTFDFASIQNATQGGTRSSSAYQLNRYCLSVAGGTVTASEDYTASAEL